MNKRLPVGTEFWTTLGPRRIVYRGERHYFQKDQRRYLCEVIQAHDELIPNAQRAIDRGRYRMRVQLRIIQD